MEERIIIPCQGICLEGVLEFSSLERAAVVCHPHPLYGGNMDNPVVTTATDAFLEKGFTTLRFNFRGVGRSTGGHDNGRGETDDVLAALSFLRVKGFEHIRLAGYSFGARMNAAVVSKGHGVSDHIMISPPVAAMSFDDIDTLPDTGLIVTGRQDEIAPPDQILKHTQRWGISPCFEVIDGCDHFYSGSLGKLKTLLTAYLS